VSSATTKHQLKEKLKTIPKYIHSRTNIIGGLYMIAMLDTKNKTKMNDAGGTGGYLQKQLLYNAIILRSECGSMQ
jgi:hypothetical protein